MLFDTIWPKRERPDKLGDDDYPPTLDKPKKPKEVYFIAHHYDKDYKKILSTSIEKGTLGFFCMTTNLYHVYLLEKQKGQRGVYYCSWDDIEPLAEEGYKILEEQLKRIKDVREARSQIDQVWNEEKEC